MSPHLITTPATITIHRRCGSLVLAGISEGIPTRVDPQPVNRVGHIAAILENRPVYTVATTGLIHLDRDRTKNPRLTRLILAAHICGHPMAPEHLAAPQPAADSACPETEGIPF